MQLCPRCHAPVTAIVDEVEVVLPGGLIDRQPTTTGWLCENDHLLAPQETVTA